MKNKWIATLFMALLMTPAFNAQAEEIITTGQVVVSATRTEMLLEDAPQTIEVISSEEIKRTGSSSVRDVLEKAFNTDIGYGGTAFTLRGLDESYVLILVNGRKVATPIGSSAINNLNINMNSIERIEVLRGQASALYGADAIGGVINIITKKSEKLEFTIGATYDPEEITNYYQLDFGKKGNWDAIVNATYSSYQALRTERAYREQNDGKWNGSDKGDAINVSADVGYQFNANNELRIYSDIFWTETEDEDGDFTGITDKYKNASRQSSNVLTYNGNVGDHKYSVSGNYNWNRQLKYGDGDKTNALRTTPEPDQIFEIYGFDAKDTWMLNDYNTLTFGGEFQRSTMAGDGQSPQSASVNYFALFVQDEIMLFDETLFILPAVRYDNYSTFGGEFSPGIGVTWEFYADHRLKANYGLGFKAPTILQLYSDDTGRFSYPANPDLKTERSSAWDVSYEGRYKNVSGSVTYHSTEIEDMIGRGTHITGRWYNRINIGEVQINGVEAELGIDFLKYFTAKGQYAYLDGKDLEANIPLYDIAKHTYQLELIFDKPDWDFYASIWTRWVRDLTEDDDEPMVNFNTVNFSMSKTFEETYTVYFNMNNVFDDKNEITANESHVRDRNWQVGFEMKF